MNHQLGTVVIWELEIFLYTCVKFILKYLIWWRIFGICLTQDVLDNLIQLLTTISGFQFSIDHYHRHQLIEMLSIRHVNFTNSFLFLVNLSKITQINAIWLRISLSSMSPMLGNAKKVIKISLWLSDNKKYVEKIAN